MVLAGLSWPVFLSPPLAKCLSLYIKILGTLADEPGLRDEWNCPPNSKWLVRRPRSKKKTIAKP
jgi:hypothetical protein